MNRANVWAAIAVVVLAGCAGSHGDPTGPDSGPVSWSKDMTSDQKVVFMKRHVVPNMAPVFQGADAKRYASFGCETCHGPSHKDPHEFLPKLKIKDGMPLAFTEKPEIAKFMASEVVPKMAATLGVAPFDETTKQGFGCGGCHQFVMQ